MGSYKRIEDSNSTLTYVSYLHTETIRGWCEDIFHLCCYHMIVLTCLYLLPPCTVFCTLVLWTSPCVTRCSSCWPKCALHRTGFTQIWPMYVVQSAVRTNLFLHGMSCDTLISHRGFLGKTAVSVWGEDYHSRHSTDWVIKDLHSTGIRSQLKIPIPWHTTQQGLGI